MAWIESHQELARHPKTKRLSRLAEISLPTAIGHLHLLWWWAIDYAQDGDLSKYEAGDIADAMNWSGDAKVIVEALVNSGFLDRESDAGLSIHDWHDYAGRLMEQRKAQADYKRRQYSLYNDMRLTKAVRNRDGDKCQYCGKIVNWNDRRGVDGGTYDHVDPDGENTPDNTVVCCRSCSSKKDGRTLEQAEMSLIEGNNMVDYGRNTVDNGKSTANKPDVIDQRFNEFWAAYPRKQGKGDARKKWHKLKPDAALHSKILTAIETAKRSRQWQRDNGQYIPHPSTWLNQGRWDDEFQTTGDLTHDKDKGSNGFNPAGMQGFKNALDRFDGNGDELKILEIVE
jgi:hypothetical protein